MKCVAAKRVLQILIELLILFPTNLKRLDCKAGMVKAFYLSRTKLIDENGTIDGKELAANEIIAITSKPELVINQDSGFEIHHINKGENIFRSVQSIMADSKNQLVFVDTS